MAAAQSQAYCTLLLSDGYLPGAMVLGHSLRDCGTKQLLVALVTLDTVSAASIEQLKTVYDQILPVDRIATKSPANLYLMDRPDLFSTFTKIAIWRQTQFKRLVYIDADVVALRAPDELFARESTFAAAPDVGWPDCFNSGVMAISPNMGDYYALLAMAQRGISFDGADQGLLNMHFTNWDRLSFTYNCTPSGHYQYVPAYRHFQSSISMLHFIGKDKPWTVGRDVGGPTGVYDELLGRWWAVYDRHFRGATYTYVPDQGNIPNETVHQHVHGEKALPVFVPPPQENVFVPPYLRQSEPQEQPRTVAAAAGVPPSDQRDPVESIERKEAIPVRTEEPRRFSAPHSEWDPITQPPPAQSRPEALNFPRHLYTMSEDKGLFVPPKSYPEPPKDMWYEVPKTPPAAEKPKQIFPWETRQAKPTRVFIEEKSPSPEPAKPLPAPIDTTATPQPEPAKPSPSTPTIQVTPVESFSSYSRTNAWDENPSIERYMSRFNFGRKAKVQVLYSSDVASPTTRKKGAAAADRPSLKLTDFPSEVERPSLPVTPAPVRRGVFWGGERDEAGDLPPAEGVTQPVDWNPLKKLEALQQQQSEVITQGPRRPSLDVPQRPVPESAPLLPTSEETILPQSSIEGGPTEEASRVSDSLYLDDKSGALPGVKSAAAALEELDQSTASGADEGIFSAT